MKVLFVCHRFPYPPKRGGKIRPFNIIRHLSQSHAVTVASLVRSAEEAREAAGLRDHCERFLMERVGAGAAAARMLLRLPTPVPSSMGYFHSPALARRIREELVRTRYDLIFVHCSSVAPYVAGVRGVRKILDFGDMDSQKWLEYARVRRNPLAGGYWLEGSKLQRAERHLARRFDCCTCTTRAELATLDSLGTAADTGWFPNGVDLDYFQPGDDAYEPDSLCFVGRMDYYPNQECMRDFCRHTWPLIRQRRPGAKLYIVGAAPSRAVLALAELPGVAVTGSVADVRPYVRRCAVSVAPLNIARGTQNKILESLAMGVPVVCSEKAAGGVDAVPGKHLQTAAAPVDYAEAILALMSDQGRRAELARAGRQRMRTRHDWQRSLRQLDLIVERTMISGSRSREGLVAERT